jgi:NAD(P)-dependent dehydrogenase (short-subunit alcohol dehydrogenase family)
MESLQNQVVMISGASQGIGFAAAQRLGRAGAKLSLCARRDEPLQQAAGQLKEQGIDVFAVPADVSRESDVDTWFKQTEAHVGPASILIPNAGISGYGDLADLTEEQFDQTMNVNVRGVFLCCKRAIPAMKEKRQGKIIMISSIASKYYRHGHSLYFATKWALNGFAFSLAKEVLEYNIHVHILCPGMVETHFFDSNGGRPHEESKEYLEPDLIAELAERLILLPDTVGTLDWAVFPDWQQHSLGLRR